MLKALNLPTYVLKMIRFIYQLIKLLFCCKIYLLVYYHIAQLKLKLLPSDVWKFVSLLMLEAETYFVKGAT